MNQSTDVLAIKKDKTKALVQFAVLTGLAMAAPFLRSQAITGPIVNATLLITTAMLGLRYGLGISLLPSVFAYFLGLLPQMMLPMIPFIITGNAILVIVFYLFKEKSYWLAVLCGAFLKFLFLFFSSSAVASLIIKQPVASKISQMMSWPQFFTALAGGVIAYLFLRFLKRA